MYYVGIFKFRQNFKVFLNKKTKQLSDLVQYKYTTLFRISCNMSIYYLTFKYIKVTFSRLWNEMEHNEFLSTFSVFKNRTKLDLGFCVFLNEDLGLKSDIFYSLKSVKLNRTQLFHFVLYTKRYHSAPFCTLT